MNYILLYNREWGGGMVQERRKRWMQRVVLIGAKNVPRGECTDYILMEAEDDLIDEYNG